MPDDARPAERRLMLLRHAKSAWPDGFDDHSRPLSERGRKAAPALGAFMARQGLAPDLALVSTARRAQETWEFVAKAFPQQITARDTADIYEVAAPEILGVIGNVDPSVETLLLVGHNPGVADLALLLAGRGDEAGREQLREKFPTAGLAVIAFEAGSWSEIARGTGRLVLFVTPRMLKQEQSG